MKQTSVSKRPSRRRREAVAVYLFLGLFAAEDETVKSLAVAVSSLARGMSHAELACAKQDALHMAEQFLGVAI